MSRRMSDEELNSLVESYKLDSILDTKELKGLIDGINEAQSKIDALESERDRFAFKIKRLFGFKSDCINDWESVVRPYMLFNMATSYKYEPKSWNLFIDTDKMKKEKGGNNEQ